MIYGIFDPLRVADVDGDGRLEVIGGPGRITCGGSCYVLDAEGNQAASHGLDGWASMMPACDVWVGSGGEHLIACGTTRSNVVALKLNDGKLDVQWKQAVGEEVRALAVGDVNGDGRPTIVAGSDCFYLYLFTEDGAEQWRKNLGSPVQQLFITDPHGGGNSDIIAVCDGGTVWAISAENEIVGRFETGATVHTVIPGFAGGLLVGTSDGSVTALGV